MEVYFENSEWRVTEAGLESIGPVNYPIDAARLFNCTDRGGSTVYEWPAQIADKAWGDIEAFLEAFVQALRVHATSASIDEVLLTKSLAYARERRRAVQTS